MAYYEIPEDDLYDIEYDKAHPYTLIPTVRAALIALPVLSAFDFFRNRLYWHTWKKNDWTDGKLAEMAFEAAGRIASLAAYHDTDEELMTRVAGSRADPIRAHFFVGIKLKSHPETGWMLTYVQVIRGGEDLFAVIAPKDSRPVGPTHVLRPATH